MNAASILFNETRAERRCRCGRVILDGEIECEKCHADKIEARNTRHMTADEIAADAVGVSPWGPL